MDRGLPAAPGLIPRIPYREPEERHYISPRWLAWSLWLFFVVIWVALGIFYVVSPDATAEIMEWVADRALIVQIGVWIVFLPVMVAMAIWESALDLWIRVVALVGCLFWTTFGLYPRKDGSL
jgi:hypothetical protein